MWRAISFSSAALLAACAAPAIPPDPRDGEAIVFGGGPGGPADACFTCHGLKGEGDGLAPRLAGQSVGYLVKQLEDYAARWRDHPQMSPLAARLDDSDRQAVATYYANLSVPAPQSMAGPPHEWRTFVEGDTARGLKACADCHGATGQGVGLANPVLAGQTREYTAAQLQAWRSADRRNDPDDVMGAIARKLTDQEIAAIAAHLEAIR